MPINQKGLAPIFILIILSLVGISFTVIKNAQNNHSKPQQEASSSAQIQTATPSASAGTKTVKTSPTPKPSITPSSSPTSDNSSTSTNNTSSSSNSTTNSSSSTSTPTPTPSSTPTSTLKSYTWNGNNINVTTKCYTGDSTFDIEFSGNVTTANSSDGAWTTLTGNGQTIVVSYDQGGYPSTTHLAFNFNDSVSSIRSGGPIELKTSGSTTYGYEIKAYSAPFTTGTPSLSNQIGSVSFATDCK